MSDFSPDLAKLLSVLRPDHYNITVYVGPDIDPDWVMSQMPDGVTVMVHQTLAKGTAVVFPSSKVFRGLASVPPPATGPDETEEPDEQDDGGDDPEQRGHGDTDPEEDQNK
jgi:hypothetical protein